jgi:hypothetical protein
MWTGTYFAISPMIRESDAKLTSVVSNAWRFTIMPPIRLYDLKLIYRLLYFAAPVEVILASIGFGLKFISVRHKRNVTPLKTGTAYYI